jgi:hypothetical protein
LREEEKEKITLHNFSRQFEFQPFSSITELPLLILCFYGAEEFISIQLFGVYTVWI